MVGAAYAIDSKYFEEIGTYDEGMTVWGGENLEMAWRVGLQKKGLSHYFMHCVRWYMYMYLIPLLKH